LIKKTKYKHLIFDFDGVLAETNEIKFGGFQDLLANYPQEEVKELLQYARKNGGLSCFAKLQYFFKTIRNESIEESRLNELANEYSGAVKQKVIFAKPVRGSMEFLISNRNRYDFAIVSGSFQPTLQEICAQRMIAHLFIEILGSPVDKASNLEILFSKTGWIKKQALFIGDSVNDYEAATKTGIDFVGRFSGLEDWTKYQGLRSIEDMTQLEALLT